MEEFGLTYNFVSLDFKTSEHKSPKILVLNPNGRVPIIVDHKNNDFTLWESGAIIQYLVLKYDTTKKLHSGNLKTDAKATQWLMFQVSGQGPYFGQLAWFAVFHHEKLPSAIERYTNEVFRVTGVLELALTGHDYLDGNTISYGDLSFVPWIAMAYSMFPEVKAKYDAGEYPNVKKWLDSLVARDSVVTYQKLKAELSTPH